MINRDLTPDEVDSLLDESAEAQKSANTPTTSSGALLTSSLFVTSTIQERSTLNSLEPAKIDSAENKAEPMIAGHPCVESLRRMIDSATTTWIAALRQPLRTTVTMELEDVQACHSAMLSQYELPGCIQSMQAAPADELMYLQLDRSVVFGMIDRLLGGGKSPTPNVRRALTEIESSLLMRITTSFVRALESRFVSTNPQSISILRIESNPQCLPLVDRSYYQARIRVKWEHHCGFVRFVFPEALLHLVDTDSTAECDLATHVAEEGVSVVVGHIPMRREDADRLQVGDKVFVAKPQVRIYVDRKRMYSGKLGLIADQKAVRVEGTVET